MTAPLEATAPAPGPARPPAATGPRPAPLAPGARLLPALGAVYRAQLSRARVARMPLLFVATFQSLGIMVMMRGVVHGDDAEAAATWWRAPVSWWSPSSR